MYISDFKYDGKWLSDAGFMVCTFDQSGGVSSTPFGAKLEFNSVKQHSGMLFSLTAAEYEDGYSSTFSICKNDDVTRDNIISADEAAAIARWLNRKSFHELVIVCDDQDKQDVELHFNGSFNISCTQFCGNIIGFELNLITDRPFAYSPQIVETIKLRGEQGVYTIKNHSDEIGATYPDSVKITCREGGDLSLKNVTENRITYIADCRLGEVITMDCVNQIITTSDSSHKICNCFNYNFFRLISTYQNIDNGISASLRCDVEIRYTPVKKVVM